jgi:hypothetical protein
MIYNLIYYNRSETTVIINSCDAITSYLFAKVNER